MEVPAFAQHQNQIAASGFGQTVPGEDSQLISSDFQTFLLMLTTQMENQDPLNPIESSDFAVQLATFSGVEQQVRTNDLLSGMVTNAAMAELSRWVGLDARVEGPVVFEGAPVLIDIGSEVAGATRRLVVRNALGTPIQSSEIAAGQSHVAWSGLDETGAPLPTGSYALSIEHRRAGEVVRTTEVASYARIVEARRAGDGTEVVLSDGRVLEAGQVEALRAPSG